MSPSRDRNEAFSWRAHPARERMTAAVAGTVVILALSVLTGLLMGSLAWGGLALVILTAPLHRFYLPSRYVVDGDGITSFHGLSRRQRTWVELRALRVGPQGGILSTASRASRRDLPVLFGADRELVIETLRRGLQEAAR